MHSKLDPNVVFLNFGIIHRPSVPSLPSSSSLSVRPVVLVRRFAVSRASWDKFRMCGLNRMENHQNSPGRGACLIIRNVRRSVNLQALRANRRRPGAQIARRRPPVRLRTSSLSSLALLAQIFLVFWRLPKGWLSELGFAILGQLASKHAPRTLPDSLFLDVETKFKSCWA